jgi:hypothetical protein
VKSTFIFDLQLFGQSPSFNATATGVGKETTFGSPVTPTVWISAQDITPTGTNAPLERTSARQQIGREEAETGTFGGAQTFTMDSDPDVIGSVLAWAMGNEVVTTDPATGNPAPGAGSGTTTTAALPPGSTVIPVVSAANLTAGKLFAIDNASGNPEVLTVGSVLGLNITVTTPTVYAHALGAKIQYATAYDHQLTFAIPRPTFTTQFNRVTDCIATAGNKVGSFDISFQPRQLVGVRFNTIYASEAAATPGTANFSLLRPYRVIDPLNTVSVNGASSLAAILSATISVNSALQGTEFVIGNGRFIQNIPEGQAIVSGSFVVQFSNNQYQKLFWGAAGATGPLSTVASCSLQFQIFSPSWINGVNRYGITILLANATLTSVPTAGRSGSPIQQTVNFQAYQSAPGADDDINITVVNNSSVAA